MLPVSCGIARTKASNTVKRKRPLKIRTAIIVKMLNEAGEKGMTGKCDEIEEEP